MYDPDHFHLRIGGVAFLAGVVATLVTTFAVISRKKKNIHQTPKSEDSWEDSLGM